MHKLAYPLPAHTAATGLPTEPTQQPGKSEAMAAAVLGSKAAQQIREQGLEGREKPIPEKSPKRRSARFSAFIVGMGRDTTGLDGTGVVDAAHLPIDGAQDGIGPTSLRSPTMPPGQQDLADLEADAAAAGLADGRFSVVGRSVRRVSRALKAVGNAMLEAESGYEAEPDALEAEVPGLVQGGLGGTFDQVEIGQFERREV
jgi:hypothetical protein